MFAPRKTPWAQSKDSVTSGTVVARRPPNRIAEIGTPFGSSHSVAMIGHWATGVVKRELGCAAGSGEAGVQSRPFQSVRWAGGWSVSPSHHTSPSSVRATLVKMLLPQRVLITAPMAAEVRMTRTLTYRSSSTGPNQRLAVIAARNVAYASVPTATGA